MSPWDPEQVRAGAVAELAPWGIVPPDHLPWVTRREERSLDDVIGRAQALYGVLDIIHGAPVDAVYAALAALGADRWISEAERRYIQGLVAGSPDVDVEYQLGWRSEALYALVWMLQLAPQLPLTRKLDLRPEYFRAIDAQLGPAPPGLTLRPVEEIAAKLDVFVCAHWAAGEQELPEELEPTAIPQRRWALQWYLIGDAEWDDVRLDV